MKFEIVAKNVEITQAIEDHIINKVSKIEKYFDQNEINNAIVHVNFEVHNNEREIEITIPLKHVILRAEENHQDLYAAIDLIVEKLERQIKKYKTRINRQDRNEQINSNHVNETLDKQDDQSNEYDEIQIVKSKHFNLKPMDEIEAVLQMDLLNHDFFIFTNAEDGSTNIVYKRKDGKYGLIDVE